MRNGTQTAPMSTAWGEVSEWDLPACLSIDLRSTGEFIVGRKRALSIWQSLLRNCAVNCALVRGATETSRRAVISFGASAFLTPECAERALQSPLPDLNSSIFAGIAEGSSVLRQSKELKASTGQGDLDLVLLCSSFLRDGVRAEQQAEASLLLPQALVHLHLGYGIRRILMETTSERMRVLAADSGVWKLVSNFPDHDRALFVATGKDQASLAGFGLLSSLFQPRIATLRLRDVEKELLCRSMHGGTDVEVAERLGISVASVKKRWASLFAHVVDIRHDLLPREELNVARRGAQKRHRVLAYVREHPEEVRPSRWYPHETESLTGRPRLPAGAPAL